MATTQPRAKEPVRHLHVIEEVQPPVVPDASQLKQLVERAHQSHALAPVANCPFCAAEEAGIRAIQCKLKEIQVKNRERKSKAGETTTKLRPVYNGNAREHFGRLEISRETLACLTLAGAIVLMALTWNTFREGDNKSAMLSELSDKHYSTIDGALGLRFFERYAVMDGRAMAPVVCDCKVWNGTWLDEIKLLTGQFDHSRWLSLKDDTIKIEGLTTLYAPGAPEQITVRQMRRVAHAAAAYYDAHKNYPSTVSELAADLKEINPITRVKEDPIIANLVGATLISGNGHTQFENELLGGRNFVIKQVPTPCQTVCLEVKSEPQMGADLNAYGWKSNAFFVQGFDHEGKLIKCADDSTTLVYALKNGRDISNSVSPASIKLFDNTDKASICAVSGNLPDKNAIRFKYFAALMAVLAALAYFYIKNLQATTASLPASELDRLKSLSQS